MNMYAFALFCGKNLYLLCPPFSQQQSQPARWICSGLLAKNALELTAPRWQPASSGPASQELISPNSCSRPWHATLKIKRFQPLYSLHTSAARAASFPSLSAGSCMRCDSLQPSYLPPMATFPPFACRSVRTVRFVGALLMNGGWCVACCL